MKPPGEAAAGTRLILVRHSVPAIEPDRPASEWSLGDIGRARASQLATDLERFAPALVVSSRETKARETARIVARGLNVPAVDAPDLHESDRSGLGFLSPEAYDRRLALFFRCPDDLVIGRETASAARTRFSAAVLSLCGRHAGQTLVVVAHGAVIALFVSAYNDVDPVSFWRHLEMPAFVVLARPSFRLVEAGPRR